MKPSFALSLSFEGIRLLHRAAGGWRVVGDVALDAEDMAAELAMLRKTAAELAPGDLRTKLLLPNEQIKYLSIETPGMDDAARRDAALLALDGATPYPVSDLAFDTSNEGDMTHIAAVARETLGEAEGFAVEHRFHPISFAAIPADQGFLGEPFFGPTAHAAEILEDGVEVEADGIAVVVIGDVELPAGPVVETEAGPEAPDPEPKAEIEASDVPADVPEQEIDALETIETPAEAPAVPSIASPEAPSPEPTPPAPIGFASRRATERKTAPKLDGVKRDDPVVSATAGAISSGQIDIEIEIDDPAPALQKPSESGRKGFLSRRTSKSTTEAISAVPPPVPEPDGTEKDRMTIFGARKSDVRGKPRFLGLILTAALLVFLAGVAAWATVFLDDGIGLSRLFGNREPQVVEVQPEPPAEITPVQTAPVDTAPAQPEVRLAALDPGLSEEDAAVLDALSDPVEPVAPEVLTDAQLEARYAASGIWPRAPNVPPGPAGQVKIEDLYLTSIDPVSTTTDAVALPDVTSFGTDAVFASVTSPAAAGTQFALDPQGFVIATAQGALSPDGFTVYLGKPPLVPPPTPTRFETEPVDNAIRTALAGARPQPRPADLVENTERAQLDGLSKVELAGFRPALRPASVQQRAEAEAAREVAAAAPPVNTDGAVAIALAQPTTVEDATKYAVRASLRPDVRPRNFARIVKRAQRAPAPKADDVRVASAAAVTPRVVKPKIPSKASVAKQATVKNALNLRKVNLIGVYGKPSSRRALVRLGNGRYKKVVVGDRIDGGKVAAIGDAELRYVKRGRNIVLKMPR